MKKAKIEIVVKKSASALIAERISKVTDAVGTATLIKPTGDHPFLTDAKDIQYALESARRNIRGHNKPRFYGNNIAVGGYVFLTTLSEAQIKALEKLY